MEGQHTVNDDKEEEDNNKDDAESVYLLDIRGVSRRSHGEDDCENDETGVRETELRPICSQLDRRIATDHEKNDRIEALSQDLEEENDANVEVDDEAGHGDCPAAVREITMHCVGEV